jgi:hypothetical protein
MGKIMGRVKTTLLLLLIGAQVVRSQVGSITVDSTGNVISPSSSNFPTGSLKVNNVNVVGGGGTGTVLISNSIWVDTAGNDSTCAKGDLNKPCATATVAVSKVTAGDTIFLGPRFSATYDQGTTTLEIPANVSVIGSGADFTVITSAVPGTSNRAGVEAGTGASFTNLTIQNTATDGIPFGNGTASPSTSAFTAAFLSGVKILGVAHGVRLSKPNTTGLQMDNVLIQGSKECFYQDISTAATTIRTSDFRSDGAGGTRSRAIFVSAGTLVARDSTLAVGNATANVVTVEGALTGIIELHNIAMTRTVTCASCYDFARSATASILVENANRTDGAQPRLTAPTDLTQLSRYALRGNNLSDLTNFSDARFNLGLEIGAIGGVQPYSDNLAGWSSIVPYDGVLVLNGKTVQFNNAVTIAGTDGGTYNLNSLGGTGGAAAIQQNVGNVTTATIADDTTVVNLTTFLTAPLVLTLPLASTRTPNQPLVIVDPKGSVNSTNTVTVARGGTDLINGSGSNVVVMTSKESGGSVTLLTDGGNPGEWRTISKGGGSRVSGLIDGTVATLGNVLMGNNSVFASHAVNVSSPITYTPSTGTIGWNGDFAPRANSTPSATTAWTPNFDLYDQDSITALAGNITVNAPTWTTAADGKGRTIRIKSDGSGPHTIAWDPAYAPMGVTLPLTIASSKTIYVHIRYNANTSKSDTLAVTGD